MSGGTSSGAANNTELVVGYLTGEYPRVTDTWIRREIAGLRRRGFDVQEFSVRRPASDQAVNVEHTTTYLLDLARSPRLATAQLRLLVRHPGRWLAALALAWKTRRPGLTGLFYQLFYLAEAGLLADELRRRHVDHLHNHLADSSCTVAMLASTLADVPFSFTVHGAAIFFQPYTWRLDEKVRRAAFVATISNYTRSQVALFADNEHYDKLHVVHCGVEPHRYEPIGRGQPRFCRLVFVGRVLQAKGLSVLLNAMARLNDTRTDAADPNTGQQPQADNLFLTVVGDGPDRSAIERQAWELGLADRVTFAGACDQQAVADYLADSDIFVLPSFSEGLPVVLMEAMAAELPVITTGIAGIPELVIDGQTGLIVPPTDVDALMAAVRRLAADPVLRSELGSAGRKKVLAEFNSDTEAERLAELLKATSRAGGQPLTSE